MSYVTGDPLLNDPPRQYQLPGHRPKPGYRITVSRLVAGMLAACAAVWLITWVAADPVPRCVVLPDATYPALDYRTDGTWWYMGHLIGYSEDEDDSCITPLG